jgi:hypothetical protein
MNAISPIPLSSLAAAPAAPVRAEPALATLPRSAGPWTDLFATGLVRAGVAKGGPPVVLTDTLRVLPLLESQGPVGWIHTAPCHYRDFVPVAQGHPAPRLRIDAARRSAEAAHLIRRAGLCLVVVPARPEAAPAMAALAAQAVQARVPLLLDGPPQSVSWQAFETVIRQGALQPLPLGDRPGATRMMASANLAGTLGDGGVRDATQALALAAQLARARQLDLHAEPLPDGRLKLRLRIDPVKLVAAGAQPQAHHITHSGMAQFNGRGLGALVLPWGAACQARLLLRNVRARIDGSHIAVGTQALAPGWVDYTEHGAMLRLDLPSVLPGRDALLHLSLPRDAVPPDGFCDIGAAEFTVETT